MKKTLLILALLAFVINTNTANAYETKANDYQIVGAENSGNIINTKNRAINYIPLNSSKTEYKFKKDNLIGYYNKETDSKLMIEADNIILLNNYIKVIKDGKYGLINKSGEIIVPPVCEKINSFTSNKNEYFIIKVNGEYKVLYPTGVIVADEDVYKLPESTQYILADDIRPEFIDSYMAAYGDILTINKVTKEEYNPEEVSVPENVQVANVEKTVTTEQDYEIVPEATENTTIENTVVIDNKDYTLVYQNGKFGLKDDRENVILAPEYDSISVKNEDSVIKKTLLITTKNDSHSIYNIRGKLVAKEKDGKIYVYDREDTYTTTVNNGQGILYKNGKEKSNITYTDNVYQYKQIGLGIPVPKPVKEIITTLLSLI